MLLLRCGNTNNYFLNGLLVDTDLPERRAAFYRELKRNGLSPRDVRFVLATHYHPDHAGLVGELMQNGARLLLFENQRDFVHFPDPIFQRQKGLSYLPIREEEALVLSFAESRAFLHGIGVEGEVVPTCSHSADGVALVTDDGAAFVGDLEPPSYLPAYGAGSPLQRDWDAVLRLDPKMLFFAHVPSQRRR